MVETIPCYRVVQVGQDVDREVASRNRAVKVGENVGGEVAPRPHRLARDGLVRVPAVLRLWSSKISIFFAKFCNFLAGSFSAVSKRNFARKYAFDSIFQALQDLRTAAMSKFAQKIGLKKQQFS